MPFVLWDIDGTLLDSGGAGRDAFALAFERTVGRPARELVEMAGKTDHQIAVETLELGGVEDGERLWPEFAGALAEALVELEPVMRARGRALPGAREAIAALAQVDGTVQSVLTGNIRPNAATKLEAFGLARHLDLDVGAYGSDDAWRPGLVSIARERLRAERGDGIGAEVIVLVGDTPRDVEAGREGGARVVGVATGLHTVDELAAAGADAVLQDLRDGDAVLAAVAGEREGVLA